MSNKENKNVEKEYIDEMFQGLQEVTEALQPLKEISGSFINRFITPEMEEKIAEKHPDLLKSARGAFDLKGTDLVEKIQTLTNTLRNHANNY